MKNTHPKLQRGIQLLLVDTSKKNDIEYGLPYYGEFSLSFNFIKMDSIPTCGVNMNRSGMNFYYNASFLDSLTQKGCNFVLLHEIFHILFDHPRRTNTNYNHHIANVAQDMIINHIILQDIPKTYAEIPLDSEGKNIGVYLPTEYNGKLIFEDLYEWLINEYKDYQIKRDKKDKEDKNTKQYGPYGKNPNSNNPIDTYSKEAIFEDIINGSSGEYMDIHLSDEVSKEMRESIVNDIIEKVKSRGFQSNSIANKTLNKLRKKKKDYLREIKRSINNVANGTVKQKTISKPNRRQISGLKGKKKVGTKLNVVLDTSGSMYGLIEKVLEYVYQKDISINLIQVDTNVQSAKSLKNGYELEKVAIKGFGGTVLMPAIHHIEQNFNSFNTVILTDGECDSLDFSKLLGKVLIISAKTKVNVIGTNGKVKQILANGD